MFRAILHFLLLASLLRLVAAGAPRAQAGHSEEQSQSATQPQAQPGSATQSNGTGNAAAKAEPAKPKRAKKIWTEDEMGKLDGKVSVVGDTKSAPAGNAAAGSGNRDASSYRNRLAPLRQQLARIETQIHDLQNAKLGGRENIARPLERLETQKKDVQAKIDAIEDEARKSGVEPGQLR
jgi:hypothetical protein